MLHMASPPATPTAPWTRSRKLSVILLAAFALPGAALAVFFWGAEVYLNMTDSPARPGAALFCLSFALLVPVSVFLTAWFNQRRHRDPYTVTINSGVAALLSGWLLLMLLVAFSAPF